MCYLCANWIRGLMTVAVAAAGLAAVCPAMSQEWNKSQVRPVSVPEQWPHAPGVQGAARSLSPADFYRATNSSPQYNGQPNSNQPANPNLPVIVPRSPHLPPRFDPQLVRRPITRTFPKTLLLRVRNSGPIVCRTTSTESRRRNPSGA